MRILQYGAHPDTAGSHFGREVFRDRFHGNRADRGEDILPCWVAQAVIGNKHHRAALGDFQMGNGVERALPGKESGFFHSPVNDLGRQLSGGQPWVGDGTVAKNGVNTADGRGGPVDSGA